MELADDDLMAWVVDPTDPPTTLEPKPTPQPTQKPTAKTTCKPMGERINNTAALAELEKTIKKVVEDGIKWDQRD